MGPGRSAANERSPLRDARATLALCAVAALAFGVAALFGADARERHAAARSLAEDYYRAHPYLDAPLSIAFAAGEDGPPEIDYEAGSADPVGGEQAELDALLAEVATAEERLPAHRLGLVPGHAEAKSLLLHPFVHAGWLALLWSLTLLASAGALLEQRLGVARYAATLAGTVAAGAAAHLAFGVEGLPLAGLSAAGAGVVGALALCPREDAHDPLAERPIRRGPSPLRFAALLGFGATLLCVLAGASTPWFPAAAQLGGFGLGAAAMIGFKRAGWVRSPVGARVSPEVGRALVALRGGDANTAIELLANHLAGGADEPLAARALGFALRKRGGAPEALTRAFFDAMEGQRREAAIALWRELAAAGMKPLGASAQLQRLAGWLRAAGCPGEARGVMLATLGDADGATLARLARERRGDPVFVLRAAEQALASGGTNTLERKALTELLAQARRDVRSAGIVVLDAVREAEAAQERIAAQGADASADLVAELAEPESDLEGNADLALGGEADSRSPLDADEDAPFDQNASFFDRDAIDLAAPEPALELPDPALTGNDALLDALHRALTDDADGLDPGELLTPGDLDETSGDLALTTLIEPGDGVALESPSLSAPTLVAPAGAGDEAEPGLATTQPGQGAPKLAVDSLFDDEKPEPQPVLRPLRVSVARPVRLADEALVIEVEGRGRAKLGYARIDAVAAAGVKGLSPSGKAVLLIDLAVGFAGGAGELRVVRLRADSFDPRALVPHRASPLAAWRALAAELRGRTRAVALPREHDPNAPFRIFADLASYEREVLGAASSQSGSPG